MITSAEKSHEKLRAIIYARVSTEEQAKHNFSLENQVEVCTRWVNDRGYELATAPFIDAGQSAKTMNRPALQKLLEYCRKHKDRVDAVVIYKIDRVARNLVDHTAIKLILSQNGISLYSATEAIDNTTTGKLVENIMATIAQFDNDTKSDRTKDGIRKRVGKGQISWVASRGYRHVLTTEGRKTIEPDPEIAPFIKRLFEEYAKGIYKVSELTRMAHSWGMRAKRSNKPIRQQAIHKILRSKLYTGRFDYKDEEIEGGFEPIISVELFNKVQFYLGTNTNNTSHPKRMLNPDFPLRVTARCAKCSGKFTGSWSRGNGGKYAYYHCAKCHAPNIAKAVFETQFIEFLQKLSPKAGDARLFKSVVTDAWQKKQNEIGQDIALFDKQIQKAEDEKQKVIDLAKRGVLDDETAKDELAKAKEKIALLRIERNEYQIDEFDLEAGLNFCLFFMENVHRLWHEATLAQKIKFQEMVFPKGVTYDYERFGTTEIASIYELKQAISEKKSTMVPPEGLEPTRPYGHSILSATRIPISPRRLKHLHFTAPFALLSTDVLY